MRLSKFAVGTMFGLGVLASAQTPAAAPKGRIMAMSNGGSYVGVSVQEIDSDRAKALKLREETGVEVTRVEGDSPAEKAGLKLGDAILQYNGQKVEGIEQFSRLVRETPAGREVKVEVFHNGAPQTVTVKVGAKHAAGGVFSASAVPFPQGAYEFKMPDMPRSFMSWQSSMLGIEAESLDGQLAQYFGVKEGVLIRSVASGSAADKGGLKAGDVIVRVEDTKVATPADITGRLRVQRGKPVTMIVMRDHKEVPVTVTIEDDRRGDLFWRELDSNARAISSPRR